MAWASGTGCDRLQALSRPLAEAPAEEEEEKTVSETIAGKIVGLFQEHPYLVQGKGAKFNVHLTVLADGMPIRAGKLTVVATGPTGKTAKVEQDAPRSPGIYGPVVAFPEPGENEMALTIDSEQAKDTILTRVTVYPDATAAKNAADAEDEAEPEGKIAFLKEQAWKIGLVTDPAARRRLVARLKVPGGIVPRAGAMAVVTPPIAGRLLPPPGDRFPLVGESVKAGDVVGVIEPPLAGPTGIQLVANRAQIQALETELLVKQLSVEVDIKSAQLEVDQARLVFERLKTLRAGDAVSRKAYEEAEHELRVAEATYEGKQQLRKPYEQARKDLQSLAVGGPEGNPPSRPGGQTQPVTMQMTLRAPRTGTVVAAKVTEGEFVDTENELISTIDLDRVWIEAQVSEFDLESVTKAPAADFTLAAYPGRRFTILGNGGGTLIDVGSVVDEATRTVPVRYEVSNPDRLLKVGMLVDVGIETARAEDALAIPESAVVDEDGRPVAYVELDGESFQKRDLELGLRDSGFVQVKSGIEEGERVVTKGGYAIRLSSVSSVIPAHGHAH
ncbi:MAG: hypothetical protein BGO49_27570 [Planctomycetales bacterium 71-10]|nr:MAG: hypothetical protein BGO49_27570 [Planctomycetales bacterium 71-10]